MIVRYKDVHPLHNMELAEVLAKSYVKYGLNAEEFILLNAYCLHSGFSKEEPDFEELEFMTTKKRQEIIDIFKSLHQRGLLYFEGSQIDVNHLYSTLKKLLESEKTVAERLYFENPQSGVTSKVQLKASSKRKGIAVVNNLHWTLPYMWSKNDMLKLANEIKEFADSIDDNFVEEYNHHLEQKETFEEAMQEEERQKQQEEKKLKEAPKEGVVILLRLKNGRYKFTYSISLPLNQKIERIKLEYGDTVQIIHQFETYDTLKFYHKFLKSAFSNRLAEGRTTEYQLTNQDLDFLKEEKFPATAMEWLLGPVSSTN